MIYYCDDNITIRDMEYADAEIIAAEERAQGWHETADKYHKRMADRELCGALVFTALYMGEVAGYNSLYPMAESGPFAHSVHPFIEDLGVLEKYQGHGIGSKLMDVAERLAFEHSASVHLAVGLHEGYGKAQRLYAKRGYLPDGSGLWYGNKPCTPYAPYENDDDLNLYLVKPRPQIERDYGQDCAFTRGREWFRYRAAAIIIEDGCLLAACNEASDYCYSVGGAVHSGESAQDAVRREVFEETGAVYEIDRLVFIHENFFRGDASAKGMNCHEICLYFLMKPRHSQAISGEGVCAEGREYMRWIPLESIGETKLYPTFFKDGLTELPMHPIHVVTRE